MTADLRDLYQEVILDHQRAPRNFRAPARADRTSHGSNPLCGDEVTVYLTLEGDRVADVSFQGAGCAICTASASMMTERIKSRSVDQVRALFDAFHELLTADGDDDGRSDALGKLAVFSGVRAFPIRVKCATLPWHTLQAALEGGRETVSTEDPQEIPHASPPA
jgi:nitrogen fixation NifU-like protein